MTIGIFIKNFQKLVNDTNQLPIKILQQWEKISKYSFRANASLNKNDFDLVRNLKTIQLGYFIPGTECQNLYFYIVLIFLLIPTLLYLFSH